MKWLKKQMASNEMRMALIFLGLILIPSGLLGYLSWRAIENEKVVSKERLRESYRQFARLAGREIDHELEKAEKLWIFSVNEIIEKGEIRSRADNFEQLIEEEPLISACFLLMAPSQVVYPSGLTLGELASNFENQGSDSYLNEYEIFRELVNRAEDLEYNSYDLEQAIATYEQIHTRISNRQLRAMTQSYIGRALMKTSEWNSALTTYNELLTKHPEIRDLNKMYLRFVAQYQIAVCLENLNRDQESVEALLTLHKDLLHRSDSITNLQYSFFAEEIQTLARRLLSSPRLTNAPALEKQFKEFSERSKKRRSDKYFVQLLDRQLHKMVVKRRHFKSKFRYISDETEDEPYLLAYAVLPDPAGIYVTGLLGIKIDLSELSQRLFPNILRNLKFSDEVLLSIINDQGKYVIGAGKSNQKPIAAQSLNSPFDFWQVAVYLTDSPAI